MLDKDLISLPPEGHMAYSSKEIEQFVAPLPEKVFLPAESFETIVTELLQSSKMGYEENSPSLLRETQNFETVILRMFLTNGRSFKSRIGERGMGSKLAADIYRALPLPHFVWVCELSLKTIYPTSVVGEIIWDATRNKYEDDGWIVIHYPEVLIVNDSAALNAYPEPAYYPLEHSTNYPVYRSNLRDIL
jgi:hypothetical protein